MKPYYQNRGIKIYCGDSREIVSDFTPPRVEIIITDPPYGIGFDTDYRRFTPGFGNAYAPVHGDDQPFDPRPWLSYPKVILWGANCYSERLPMGTWLVWDKRHPNGTAFLADAEVAWMSGGHGVYIFSKTWQGCIRSEPAEHPTQKPIALMAWCIEKARVAGVILDPYMGSGTTLVAAYQAGRQAIGIDIEERYCEIAARRIEDAVLPMFDAPDGGCEQLTL